MLTVPTSSPLTSVNAYPKLQKMNAPFNVGQSPPPGSMYPKLEPIDALHEADAKCEELENLTLDLETRLENQATERMNLEKSFAEERRKLKQKLAAAESQTTELRELCNREKKMKQNVDDRLRRAEMELYHVLQRKYDIAKDVKAALKKEMVDNVKIKKDLTIREHLLSQKHQATLGPSKGRHISTPKHGHSQAEVTRSAQAISVLADFFSLSP